MYQLQGNPKVDGFRALRENFRIENNKHRVAMAMLRRMLERMKNIEKIKAIRNWKEQQQKDKLLKAMDSQKIDSLMDELAKAKEDGALGMFRLIMKKMQNAAFARSVMCWKKNRSCEILEGKIDGGGLAFLQDAKLKEEQRHRAEEAQKRAERLTKAREEEKRKAGLRMMRRIRRRMEGDAKIHATGDMIRNFRDWEKEERRRLQGLGQMRS